MVPKAYTLLETALGVTVAEERVVAGEETGAEATAGGTVGRETGCGTGDAVVRLGTGSRLGVALRGGVEVWIGVDCT